MPKATHVLIPDPITKEESLVAIPQADFETFGMCTVCAQSLAVMESPYCYECGLNVMGDYFLPTIIKRRMAAYESGGSIMNLCFDKVPIGSRVHGHAMVAQEFTNCRFVQSKFIGVDFSKCRFDHVNFTGALFVGCNFHSASLSNCTIERAVFMRTNFTGSTWSTMAFASSIFKSLSIFPLCTFSNVQFKTVIFNKCSFQNAHFDPNCTINSAKFVHTNFTRTNLSHVRIVGSLFGRGTSLRQCNLADAALHATIIVAEPDKLTKANLKNAKFSKCDLPHCDLSRSYVDGLAFLEGNDLTHVRLRQSQLNRISFSKEVNASVLKRQKLTFWETLLLWDIRYAVGSLIEASLDSLAIASVCGVVLTFLLQAVMGSQNTLALFFIGTLLCYALLMIPIFYLALAWQKRRFRFCERAKA